MQSKKAFGRSCALPWEKRLLYPLNRSLGGPRNSSAPLEEVNKYFLSMLGTEPEFLGSPARNAVTAAITPFHFLKSIWKDVETFLFVFQNSNEFVLGAPGVLEWRGKLICVPPSEHYVHSCVVLRKLRIQIKSHRYDFCFISGTIIRMKPGEFSGGTPRWRRSQGDYYIAEVPNALKSNAIPLNVFLGK